MDSGSRRVWVDEKEIDLTSLEFDLLVALADHHSLVLSRQQLLEKVWGYDYFGDMRVVDVHIGHLRQKIGDSFIETVRGAGYRFEDKEKNV
jgi:two-component system alkaline phosphatase synthesis response regulator PhoP